MQFIRIRFANFSKYEINFKTMYLKIALRNILKNKGFSLINILGFSLGITCFLLLCAYIYHETNYDRFLDNSSRIALVSSYFGSSEDSKMNYSSVTPTAVAPTLEQNFPEVQHAVRLYSYNGAALVRKGEELLKQSGIVYADSDFLEVFNYEILSGNKSKALEKPNSIVITKSIADKFFLNTDPVGKTLSIDKTDYFITAIIGTPPSYSEVQFSALISNQGLARYKEPIWGSANDHTFILVNDAKDFPKIEEKLNQHIQELFKEDKKNGVNVGVNIQTLSSLHLKSKSAGTGSFTYIYIFASLAAALLIISCVNFMNLSLAQASERSKEIGVKKVFGAQRKGIFQQFLIEGSLMVFISMMIGLLLSYLLFPFFSSYLGMRMELNIWRQPYFYFILLSFFLLLSLLASGWPAWIIARYNPIKILKQKSTLRTKKINISNVLITFQYTISIFLVICTFFAYKQMHYLQNMDTGLYRERIIVLDGDLWNNQNRQTLKNMLLQKKSIASVSASYDSPVNIQGGYSIKEAEGKGAGFSLSLTAIPVEKDFLSLFEIPIIAGSAFTDADIARSTDSTENRSVSFVINKLTASKLDWTPQEAIGKRIMLNGRKGQIKAVVENFNFASLRERVGPIVIFPEYYYFGKIFIKLNPNVKTVDGLADIQQVWKNLMPNSNFESHFLDDDYAKLYLKEQQTSKITLLFAVVTISIACIGLFALSAYATQKRIKEIGIRKVLGSSTRKIALLLTRDFLWLIFVAFLIAVPTGLIVMKQWFENFAFHTNLDWWVFLLAGSITLFVSFLTIGSHTLKAARENPIKSLRDE